MSKILFQMSEDYQKVNEEKDVSENELTREEEEEFR